IRRRIPSSCDARPVSGSAGGTSSGGACVARSSSRRSISCRMPADAFALTLAAAVLHASWNVFLRGSDDVEAGFAVVLGVSLLLFAPVAAVTWSVSWAAAPSAAASPALAALYSAPLVAAYRRRERSAVYRVARGP